MLIWRRNELFSTRLPWHFLSPNGGHRRLFLAPAAGQPSGYSATGT